MNKRLVTVGRKKTQAQGGAGEEVGERRAVEPDFLLILSVLNRAFRSR